MVNEVTKGENVQDKQERTKHQTLGDTLGHGSSRGGAVVDIDDFEMLSICERWSQSREGSTSDVEGAFKVGEKNGVVDFSQPGNPNFFLT